MQAALRRFAAWLGFEGTPGEVVEKLLLPVTITAVGLIVSYVTFYSQQRAEEARSQRAILQAYFDGIQTLLLEEELRSAP